ncbi:MAG TPA: hypothetical protein VFZ57_00565 [Thermoanaerobaculia bacterium]|nr:hypothetical protein [Thermoanaerobaculia bacterium]
MARRLLAVAALTLFASCGREARDPVRETVNRVAAAAESRDAGAVAGTLSAGFRDADGGSKADAADLLRRTLAAYESISLTLSDVTIERGPQAARATFRVGMSGKPRAVAGLEGLLPRTSSWRFELRLELEKGSWKITSASWRRLEESG